MFKSKKLNRRRSHSTNKGSRCPVEALEQRRLLSAAVVTPSLTVSPLAGSSASASGYTPAQIRAAYGFTSISGNGAGQTIAIVDAYGDPNIAADLKAFDAKEGLADTTLNIFSETGGSAARVAASRDWSAEIALDVEWAHAIAPGATIDLVEASSDSTTDLLAAVKTARSLSGVSVVSMSWGSSEFSGETKDDTDFTTPSGHQGVTFVAAAGDDGTTSAEWPASSPNVLSVGGTTLKLTSSNAISSETTWSDTTGGVSSYETVPAYQSAVSGTKTRSTPDVSYDADPNTGFAVYDSYGSGGWTEVGGTSAGTPQWAALVALADQVRASKGLGTLDGATGTLPAIYAAYGSSATSTSYTAAFNDVTTGSNGSTSSGFGGSGYGGGGYGGGYGGGGYGGGGFGGGHGGRFFDVTASVTPAAGGRSSRSTGLSAAAGYDEVTGLGTPKASTLVADLAAYVTPTVTTTTAKKTTTTVKASKVTRSAHASVAFANHAVAPVALAPTPAVLAALVAGHGDSNAAVASNSMLMAGDARSEAVSESVASSTASSLTPGSHATPIVSSIVFTASLPAEATPGLSTVAFSDLLGGTAATTVSQAAKLSMFDAAATFKDAVSTFIGDATGGASLATTLKAAAHSTSGLAIAATAAVLAADAVLIGRWLSRRPQAKGKRGVALSPFRLVPVGNAHGFAE